MPPAPQSDTSGGTVPTNTNCANFSRIFPFLDCISHRKLRKSFPARVSHVTSRASAEKHLIGFRSRDLNLGHGVRVRFRVRFRVRVRVRVRVR